MRLVICQVESGGGLVQAQQLRRRHTQLQCTGVDQRLNMQEVVGVVGATLAVVMQVRCMVEVRCSATGSPVVSQDHRARLNYTEHIQALAA